MQKYRKHGFDIERFVELQKRIDDLEEDVAVIEARLTA